MSEAKLRSALSHIERGRWLVGVSGGADSVALLTALRQYRADLELVVAHFDHQSRGAESDADREFVIELSTRLSLKSAVGTLDEFGDAGEPNLEARYRSARLRFFEHVVRAEGAQGILLAQHANDRAETVLLRLLRQSEPWALDALHRDRFIGPLRVIRPLLEVSRIDLEQFLRDRGQTWREDSSNQSDAFARNRLRPLLREQPALVQQLLRLGDAAADLRAWVETASPQWAATVNADQLADLPDPPARKSVRDWLRLAGVVDAAPEQVEAIVAMSRDRTATAAVALPGGWIARRKRGAIILVRSSETR